MIFFCHVFFRELQIFLISKMQKTYDWIGNWIHLSKMYYRKKWKYFQPRYGGCVALKKNQNTLFFIYWPCKVVFIVSFFQALPLTQNIFLNKTGCKSVLWHYVHHSSSLKNFFDTEVKEETMSHFSPTRLYYLMNELQN